ncbi:MAG: hypothetical protein GXP14_11660 [Gammaproteobacteria bacterium]|nr:hypothetical protein [Gammaproteobacteria bacterium]
MNKYRYMLRILLVVFITGIPIKYSFAQPGDLINHFEPPVLQDFARYGSSMTTLGENLIIGSYGTNGGSVYVYDYNNNSLLTQINNPGIGNGQFGWSVTSNDSTFLVGARLDNTGATYGGIAYRYDINGTLLNTYQNPNPADHVYFGQTVAYSGNNIVIGAKDAIYILDTDTGSLIQEIEDPTLTQAASFGAQVSTSSESIIVSATKDDTIGIDSGAVYLFDNQTGLLSQTLNNPNPDIQLFGTSIASNDNKVLVGAPDTDIGPTSAGQAYIFDELTGNLLLTIEDPNASLGNFFGSSVDWLGTDILIGAPGTDSNGQNNSGAAYLFSGETGDLIYTFLGTGDTQFSDLFGASILGFNGEVLVGSPNEDYLLGCYLVADEWGNEYEEGDYSNSGGVYRFESSTTVVPLPASLWLFVCGVLMLFGTSKRIV